MGRNRRRKNTTTAIASAGMAAILADAAQAGSGGRRVNCDGPRDHGGKAVKAKTPLKIDGGEILYDGQSRVDDDMKGDGGTLPVLEHGRIDAAQIVLTVFDDCQLQWVADLWCGQANAGGFTHGLAHLLDEPLGLSAADLVHAQRPRPLP